MGNSQSQDSDNGHGRPAYNYHESVLQNAQQLCNASVRGYESDDPYFSAEEGEESDRSITPPRTRPESSSGEDFSDDSAIDDTHNTEGAHGTSQTCVDESSINLLDDSQTFLSPKTKNKRLLAVGKSCGQCNVSRLQEQDSIGPELDRSRWDVSANNSSARTTRQSTHRSQDQIQTRTSHECGPRQSGFSNSPFIPINSPPDYHNMSQRSRARKSSIMKRKANQSSNEFSEEEGDLSGKRRHTLSLSPNKRRLAMLDESDSDSDNYEKVTPRKKAFQKKTQNSPQQSRSSHATQTDVGNLKRNLKEGGSEHLTELSDSAKRQKFSLSTKKLNVLGKRSLELHTGELTNYSPKVKNVKIDESMNHSEISIPTTQPSIVLNPQVSAFQPVDEGPNVTNTRQQIEVVGHSITKTLKMGNAGVRNSLGKVLPIRKSHHCQNSSLTSSNVAESSNAFPPIRTCQSDIGLPENYTRNLRPNETTCVQIGNSDNSHDSDAIPSCSPFHSVVLTPPSSSVILVKDSTTHSLERVVNVDECVDVCENFNGNDIDMETDVSQPEMSLMESQFYTSRQFATAKRNFSTAERFKQFFTEGSLKSNIKTLFSKRKSGQNRESHSSNTLSNQTAWSLYSSPSSASFGQSPSSNQATAFHSTSSPIEAGHCLSVSDNRINFCPNISNVTNASPTSVHASGGKGLKRSTSNSSLMLRKGGAAKKSASVGHVVTRTSPRLRPSKTSASLNTSKDSRDSLELHASSDDVLLLSQTSEFQVLHYQLSQTLEISLAMGDIAEESSSGIVNWTDGALTHNATECSRRICAKAGALMRAGCNSYIENKDGALEAPDVLTTPAGGKFPRSVKALLHVVSPTGDRRDIGLATCLLEVNANCLRFASERLGLDSLSMPLIGEGELPTNLCAEAFIDAVLTFIFEKKSSLHTSSPALSLSSSASLPGIELSSISLVTSDANVTDEAADAIQARIDCVKTNNLDSVVSDIRNSYYGNRNIQTSRTTEGIVVETPDRAKSGRPRVKRPRL